MWLYKDHEGAASSWEKYTVTEADNTVITIEMSTKFPGSSAEYSIHHKYELDLVDAYEVHDDFDDEPIWVRGLRLWRL